VGTRGGKKRVKIWLGKGGQTIYEKKRKPIENLRMFKKTTLTLTGTTIAKPGNQRGRKKGGDRDRQSNTRISRRTKELGDERVWGIAHFRKKIRGKVFI